MKQQLRKPENWQDFEELCQVLWGDIWQCPEIRRNGRSGQKQDGIDIYGIPKGEMGYYGIQCKGKDENLNAKLSENEVDREIEKAKSFKPKLRKLYFATTSNKDVYIEEYVRIKDIECREQGLFEVHLFSWEDIVNLIDQSQRAHDWYVKKLKFKLHFSASFTFDNGSDKIHFTPKLFRTFHSFKPQGPFEHIAEGKNYIMIPMPEDYHGMFYKHKKRSLSPQPINYQSFGETYENKSSILFGFKLKNTGDKAIEDFKVEFLVKGSFSLEVVSKRKSYIDLASYTYDVQITDSVRGLFEPKSRILIQDDSTKSDILCIRPTIEEEQAIVIEWKLLARDFNTKGELVINIAPEINRRFKDFYVYDSLPEDSDLSYDDEVRQYYRLENDID